jgi:hypothetical protein
MSVDSNKIPLIDTDIFRYQIGSIERDHPYIDDVKTPASYEFVKDHVIDLVNRCIEVGDCIGGNFQMFFTSGGNFRFDIAKEQPYKETRKEVTKPANWIMVDEIVRKYYNNVLTDVVGYEADDAISFHRFEPNTYDYLMCSRDKDITTVPGWHYRWACGVKQPEVLPYFKSVFEANKFFFYQCLIGDSTDNIPGCGRKELVYWGAQKVVSENYGMTPASTKAFVELCSRNEIYEKALFDDLEVEKVPRRIGIGAKEAEEILSRCTTIRDMAYVVNEEYCKRFPGEDFESILLENARLLYMGQSPLNLFNWSWFDGLWEVDSSEEYYNKTEYELRSTFNED